MPTAKRKPSLYCHEEILLLALEDDEGTVKWQAAQSYPYGMAGGILAELLLAGRICVEDDDRQTVNAMDIASVGEAVLDDCLTQVYAAKGRRTLQDWVVQLGQAKKLRERVADGLCARGVLKKEEGKSLLVLRRTRYPERDPGPERRMIERLRQAIFTDDEQVEPRTAILVALAHGAGLLEVPFAGQDLQLVRDRIERIIGGQLTPDPSREAAQALRVAAILANLIPAIVVLADNGP